MQLVITFPNQYVNEIFSIFKELNPEPKTELAYLNPYTLLVAVVLSAQATDASVNKATNILFERYNTPEMMVKLGEKELKEYIKSIGLYNSKAKNIIALSNILVDKYNNEVPSTLEELIALPGVGRKTANVVLNCLYNLPTMPVDTHVFRVAKRLKLASKNKPEQVENELLTNIPEKWLYNAHHWLILHGRYTCKAQRPLCKNCSIREYCPSRQDLIPIELINTVY